MQHVLTTLHKADAQRLACAAAGLADGSISVQVIHQDGTEARALVTNGDGKDYTVAISAHDTFCSCEGTEKGRCIICEAGLDADHGLRIEDGNNGAVIQAGPFCEPYGLARTSAPRSSHKRKERMKKTKPQCKTCDNRAGGGLDYCYHCLGAMCSIEEPLGSLHRLTIAPCPAETPTAYDPFSGHVRQGDETEANDRRTHRPNPATESKCISAASSYRLAARPGRLPGYA